MTIDRGKREVSKVLALASSPLGGLVGGGSWAAAERVTRIAFGSCLDQDKEQPIWDAVLASQPDVFVFLGDNIYGDSDDPRVLQEKYDRLGAQGGFKRLREAAEVVATWDDHDYGRNDAGKEYPVKAASREVMLSFWNEPHGSERWTRPDGIYTSYFHGEEGRRVQVILLDLRWNRSPLTMVDSEEAWLARDAGNMGPYSPTDDLSTTLLGEAQWEWLEAQLNEPADLRIIGSSIQLLADFTGWETWANFPHERERFLSLIAEHQEVPLFIISGDVHWCELSRYSGEELRYPLLELTSSGLTEVWEQISPNRHRQGEAHAIANYGLITIDWLDSGPSVTLEARDVMGRPVVQHRLSPARSG